MNNSFRGFCRVSSSLSEEQNKLLEDSFQALKNADHVNKTHYIRNRFENIYISREKVTGLNALLIEALSHASRLIHHQHKLKVGFWFNEMQPGTKTSAHSHEEDDELLSGVYYIHVPENSGDLVLGDKDDDSEQITTIKPRAGELIFFSPKLVHSVEENKSSQTRLSIGMNFGPEDGLVI